MKSTKCSVKMTGQALPNCTTVICTTQQEPSFAKKTPDALVLEAEVCTAGLNPRQGVQRT